MISALVGMGLLWWLCQAQREQTGEMVVDDIGYDDNDPGKDVDE